MLDSFISMPMLDELISLAVILVPSGVVIAGTIWLIGYAVSCCISFFKNTF